LQYIEIPLKRPSPIELQKVVLLTRTGNENPITLIFAVWDQKWVGLIALGIEWS